MNGGEEIVAASHMAQLVRENRAKLSRIQVFQKLGWYNQDRAHKTKNARLLCVRADERGYGDREFDGCARPAMLLELATSRGTVRE